VSSLSGRRSAKRTNPFGWCLKSTCPSRRAERHRPGHAGAHLESSRGWFVACVEDRKTEPPRGSWGGTRARRPCLRPRAVTLSERRSDTRAHVARTRGRPIISKNDARAQGPRKPSNGAVGRDGGLRASRSTAAGPPAPRRPDSDCSRCPGPALDTTKLRAASVLGKPGDRGRRPRARPRAGCRRSETDVARPACVRAAVERDRDGPRSSRAGRSRPTPSDRSRASVRRRRRATDRAPVGARPPGGEKNVLRARIEDAPAHFAPANSLVVGASTTRPERVTAPGCKRDRAQVVRGQSAGHGHVGTVVGRESRPRARRGAGCRA
jgi:hypothetical protein